MKNYVSQTFLKRKPKTKEPLMKKIKDKLQREKYSQCMYMAKDFYPTI